VIKLRRIRWMGGTLACMGEMRNTYRILVRKPEGKRPLWKPMHGWKENIKMDLKELGCEGSQKDGVS